MPSLLPCIPGSYARSTPVGRGVGVSVPSPRKAVRSWNPSWLLLGWSCCLIACGGAQVRGSQTPTLPPLPESAWATLPADAEVVAHLDLRHARESDAGQVFNEVRERSCFQGPSFDGLWSGTQEIALAMGSDADNWILALAGEAPELRPLQLAELVRTWYPGADQRPHPARAGRLEGQQIAGITVVEVSAQLVVVLPNERFAALAQAYDDPTRQGYVPPQGLNVRRGMLGLWDTTGRISTGLLRRLPQGVVGPLRHVPLAVSTSAGPAGIWAEARAELDNERTAASWVTTLSSQLKNGALFFGLLGLPPLHERIKGQHEGATVEVRVDMTRSEIGRLLKLAEGQLAEVMHGLCERLAAEQRAAQ